MRCVLQEIVAEGSIRRGIEIMQRKFNQLVEYVAQQIMATSKYTYSRVYVMTIVSYIILYIGCCNQTLYLFLLCILPDINARNADSPIAV